MRVHGFLWVLFLISAASIAGDWTQWRGPDRQGLTTDYQKPAQWPASLKTVWEIDAGEGYAGPLVKGKQVYVFGRTGDEEHVAAYNLADGSQVWKTTYAAPFEQSNMARMHGKGPFATPTIANNLLLTIGMTEILSAFDLGSGKLVWKVDFPKDHKGGNNVFGSASPPLVVGTHCLVQAARNKGGALYSVNVKTGAVEWFQENDGQASTPLVVFTLDGQQTVLAKSSKGVAVYDLDKGTQLWKMPYTIRYDHPIVTPICEKNTVIFGDYNRETSKVKLVKTDGKWQPEIVWENKDVNFYMSSPVKMNERVFGFSSRKKGSYVSMNTQTGALIWSSEGRLGKNAMLVGGDGVVFGLTEDGQLRVIDATSTTYKELAVYKVSELPTWGPPAVLEQGFLVKDTQKLKRLAW